MTGNVSGFGAKALRVQIMQKPDQFSKSIGVGDSILSHVPCTAVVP